MFDQSAQLHLSSFFHELNGEAGMSLSYRSRVLRRQILFVPPHRTGAPGNPFE